MTVKKPSVWLVSLAVVAVASLSHITSAVQPRRNVIVFVADALRHGSVTEQDTPALWARAERGRPLREQPLPVPDVHDGQRLGDRDRTPPRRHRRLQQRDLGGLRDVRHGQLRAVARHAEPFIENDRMLADLDDHFGGNYLGEDTLMASRAPPATTPPPSASLARSRVQDVEALAPVNGGYPPFPAGIVIDDATGTAAGPPLPPTLIKALALEGIPPEAPTRSNGYGATSQFNNGYSGDRTKAGTLIANIVQQQWFADAATRVILPSFARRPTSRSCWSSGRATPTARSTTRATASTRWRPASTDRRRDERSRTRIGTSSRSWRGSTRIRPSRPTPISS